jgi:hypothetical protein
MLRRALEPGEGLLMVEDYESRVATAIHMLFMLFPIAVIWLNSDFKVVDKKLARPWRLVYAPSTSARYTLEASPSLLDEVSIDDCFQYVEQSG